MLSRVGTDREDHSGGITACTPEVLIALWLWVVVHNVDVFELGVAFPSTVGVQDSFEYIYEQSVGVSMLDMAVLLINGGGRVLTDDQLAITEGEVFTENPVKSTGRLGRLFNDRSTHHQRILVAFLELFDLLSCVGVFWFASLLVHPQSIGCADAVVVRKGCSPV